MPRSTSAQLATVVLALAIPGSLAAQFGVRVRWPLMDIVVRGDSTNRLEVITSPNLSSTQGNERMTQLRRLQLDPVTAMQWATLMRRVVDSAGDRPRVSAPRAFFPLLKRADSRDGMQLAVFAEKGKPPFGFAVAGADTTEASWTVRVSAKEVRGLLDALVDVGGAAAYAERRAARIAALDDPGTCPLPEQLFTAADESEPPVPISTEGVAYPRQLYPRSGRVWLQFVIDSTGVVARGSECVLLSDAFPFTTSVLAALPRFQFTPAREAGMRVPSYVFIEIRFVAQARPR